MPELDAELIEHALIPLVTIILLVLKFPLDSVKSLLSIRHDKQHNEIDRLAAESARIDLAEATQAQYSETLAKLWDRDEEVTVLLHQVNELTRRVNDIECKASALEKELQNEQLLRIAAQHELSEERSLRKRLEVELEAERSLRKQLQERLNIQG